MAEASIMQISLPDTIEKQSLEAGFANAELYVNVLIFRDRERLAIEEEIAAPKDGRKIEKRPTHCIGL